MNSPNYQQNILVGDNSKIENVLIFGGAGSLGTRLVETYLQGTNNIIYVASRDEAKHWDLKNKVLNNRNLHTHVVDMRDLPRVKQILSICNPTTIIIAGAMKQIDTCEFNPTESIATNILGIQNILDAIKEQSLFNVNSKIERLCFVSTDKAANPINVYGMCKSIAEKLVIAASKHNEKVKYIVVRYGNVLASKGSIIPLVIEQSRNPEVKEYTLTDERMTRFVMTLDESVALINVALNNGKSGEIWIPKLSSMLIKDLLELFSEKTNKGIKVVGIRPGEKLHEILYSDVEALKIIPANSNYFVIQDHFIEGNQPVEYSSKDNLLMKEQLRERLRNYI